MASFPDEETAMRLASEQDRAPRFGTLTPTPWHHDHLAIFAGDGVIARIPNHPDNGVNWDTDAAFIVKAVNNYEALVEYVSSSASNGCATANALIDRLVGGSR